MKRKSVHDHKEYPLYGHYEKCSTARYVGGTSRYLCECQNPLDCKGVQVVAQEEKKEE